ncbi:hypothetical protein DL98DRAFT_517729 [Cadophora sp. DSE1049]|nr:hypothetical protein DL98DRAFT_517729 [Cadophora sp. DSE1049]
MKLRGWGRSVIGKRKESVKQAEKAKQEMEEEAKTKTSALGHVMLLGNKIGLEDQRAIGVSEGRKCADELGMLFGECSAKTGIGLEESVDQLASVLRARGLDS